jgi:hypothetical protein
VIWEILVCVVLALLVIVLIVAYREIVRVNRQLDALEKEVEFYSHDNARLTRENLELRVKARSAIQQEASTLLRIETPKRGEA